MKGVASYLSLVNLLILGFAVGEAYSQDCNGNGIPDADEIASATEEDCNGNGILDICETGGYVAPPVEQDVCQLAHWICPSKGYYGTTSVAANEGSISGSCGMADSAPDVWYVYVPSATGTVTVSLCGSSYDTVLAIYDGCPTDGGSMLACDYNGCGNWDLFYWTAQIGNFAVNAGQEYYIRVSGYHLSEGDFRIHLTGPPCLFGDCSGTGAPDGCESGGCGAGVLCYDDGDGAADTVINEPNPASFLVKFSAPDTFTGVRQVARVSWYAGSGTIENPKAVVRADLSGGFGTWRNCIVEDIDQVTPNRMNRVDFRENPGEFLVAGGDVFYAGVYGNKMSLGADTAASTVVMTANALFEGWGTGACNQVDPPSPALGPGVTMPCWYKRNYKLSAGGVQNPTDNLLVTAFGTVQCHFRMTTAIASTSYCTPGGTCYPTPTLIDYCSARCSQSFQLVAYNWLIRATLAGTLSPELIGGCYDRTFPTADFPDLDADGAVDAVDLLLLVHKFHTPSTRADLDGNFFVDWRDLCIFSRAWGRSKE